MKATDINRFRANHMNKRANLEDLQDVYKKKKVQKLSHLSPGNYTNYALPQIVEYLNVPLEQVWRVDKAERTLDTCIVFFINGLQTTFNTYEFQDYFQSKTGFYIFEYEVESQTAHGDNKLGGDRTDLGEE